MSSNKKEKSTSKTDSFNRSCHDATLISPGPPALYLLNTERDYIDGSEKKVSRWTYGKRGRNSQNKVILLVGETNAGKTTIINTMINYLLGVKFEDEEFYQITEEPEKHDDQTQSQTSAITVYEVSVEENPTSLTIIDTPGYGNTEGFKKDREISEYLIRLLSDEDGINYIDAVCFLMRASQNRLSRKEFYIFHSVLSLLGKDIKNNIVFLLTHSDGGCPTDALNAINTAEIPCRRDEDNEPLHFLFNNKQKEKRDKQYEQIYRSTWEMGDESMTGFFTHLEENNRKSVEMTLNVLKERSLLEACVSNLKELITEEKEKTEKLTQIQEAVKKNRDQIQKCENFKFTVKISYKKKVPIETGWWWSRNATCCHICQENCHDEWACWWVSPSNLSRCSVIENDHCTVCPRKCHYREHEKENKKYMTETKQVEKTFNEIKNEYECTSEKPGTSFDKEKYENTKKEHERNMKEFENKIKIEENLNRDLKKIKKEKANLVHDAYIPISFLSKLALKTDSAFTLKHLDVLIPTLKEEGRDEWVKHLEDLRKTGEEQKNKEALYYLLDFDNSLIHL